MFNVALDMVAAPTVLGKRPANPGRCGRAGFAAETGTRPEIKPPPYKPAGTGSRRAQHLQARFFERPTAAILSALRAAFGGCAPRRAYGRSTASMRLSTTGIENGLAM